MADMLVRLFDLRDDWSHVAAPAAQGIVVRKPIGPEHDQVIAWVRAAFGAPWASEVGVALANRPVSCFVAILDDALVGFACYDATALGFFGPSGVAEAFRRRGIGAALLRSCLLDMKLKGYGYAIIGGVGPGEFYRKIVGATEIPDSTPGVYRGVLRGRP
ncbi:MAG: GNAT family N-acetyltransferase [Burkholderiales bacterium]|nr:GNAT family N-acetyltransferase [Burkholderiales bacterium]